MTSSDLSMPRQSVCKTKTKNGMKPRVLVKNYLYML